MQPLPTILTGVPQATLQVWLTEARAAYAQLASGGKIVSVSYDGKSTTFSQANIENLESWIELLMRALGMGRVRRAIRPYFR
jgi:gpW